LACGLSPCLACLTCATRPTRLGPPRPASGAGLRPIFGRYASACGKATGLMTSAFSACSAVAFFSTPNLDADRRPGEAEFLPQLVAEEALVGEGESRQTARAHV